LYEEEERDDDLPAADEKLISAKVPSSTTTHLNIYNFVCIFVCSEKVPIFYICFDLYNSCASDNTTKMACAMIFSSSSNVADNLSGCTYRTAFINAFLMSLVSDALVRGVAATAPAGTRDVTS